MHINTAMFEQSGGSGYVLKPQVMWDKTHPLYNKFNPTEKDVEGLHPYTFTLYVSSVFHNCKEYFLCVSPKYKSCKVNGMTGISSEVLY